MSECCCQTKQKMRSCDEIKSLTNRLNRIEGQIRGLKKMLDKKKVSYSLFASPFSTDIPDMIKVQDTVFIKSDSVDFNVNSTDLISLNEEYFRVYRSYQYMLESSRRSLEKASEYHFALESIYSNAVRFWDNEKQYDHIVASIDRILDK